MVGEYLAARQFALRDSSTMSDENVSSSAIVDVSEESLSGPVSRNGAVTSFKICKEACLRSRY
jgi:hypothetical protein